MLSGQATFPCNSWMCSQCPQSQRTPCERAESSTPLSLTLTHPEWPWLSLQPGLGDPVGTAPGVKMPPAAISHLQHCIGLTELSTVKSSGLPLQRPLVGREMYACGNLVETRGSVSSGCDVVWWTKPSSYYFTSKQGNKTALLPLGGQTTAKYICYVLL